MLHRHVFDKISTEFRGIFRVFVNFVGFCRFTRISRLHAKYQKPWHCHVYSNNNYCHSTFSAVQILKIAYVRRDPLMAQAVFPSHSKAFYACLPSAESKQCFFGYFYQEMVNSKSCSWEECKRQ